MHQALAMMAQRYSSAAVAMGHNAPTRAIRHAEARDLVGRNVATLVETPKGQYGRPSNSLTFGQASALLAATEGTRMHAYISLCLATGIRTEEARALRWEHVDFGDPVANPPVPASAAVWRSVRSHGDTKTEKSRRTLALPQMAVNALWAHKEQQVAERPTAAANGAIVTWSSLPGRAVPWTRLNSSLQGTTMKSRTFLHVATDHSTIKAGGGTANTAFLATSGNPPGGNAQATLAEATFWIETIAGTGGQPDKHQLQYTQLVMLDFNGIHWPHVTVGTLVKQ
jgi:integrase